MYPKVFEDFQKHLQEYSDLTTMDTPVFFHGLVPGEVTQVEIADGKILFIKLITVGDPDEDGNCNVVFELNGIRREITAQNAKKAATAQMIELADPANPMEIGAGIQGRVSRIVATPGAEVKMNDVLVVIEAMKMETTVVARANGVVDEICVRENQPVKAGQLLIRMK